MIADRRGSQILDDSQGQAIAAGIMLVMLFVMIAGAVYDVYKLTATRAWAYRIVGKAALAGVQGGRDYSYFMSTGHIALNAAVAESVATDFAQYTLTTRGLSSYTLDVEVLPWPDGGTVPGFPPVDRANQFGGTTWTASEPSVGVYLAVTVDPVFFGLTNGGGPVMIHAFGSAGVVQP
jgi:hypothetical protein